MVPMEAHGQGMRSHLVSILVENRPGVLARVAALFSARGYNIEGLTAAHAQGPQRSRITCITWGDDQTIERIVKQLRNLVDVIGVSHGSMGSTRLMEREMLLVRLHARGKGQKAALNVARQFKARTVARGPKQLVLEATGEPGELARLLEALEPYGIQEVARSGPVVLVGSSKARGRSRRVDPNMKSRDERIQAFGALPYTGGKE